jgi:hypothetical protein
MQSAQQAILCNYVSLFITHLKREHGTTTKKNAKKIQPFASVKAKAIGIVSDMLAASVV